MEKGINNTKKGVMIAGAILAPAMLFTFLYAQPEEITSKESTQKINQEIGKNTTESSEKPTPLPEKPLQASAYERIHSKTFFEKESFWPGVSSIKNTSLFTLPKPILGGTIPHHLIPTPAIASFFKELQKQHPKTLIILSPNHFQAGTSNILMSNFSYPTPFGNLKVDQELYAKIQKDIQLQDLLEENHKGLENDHGIGSLAPFIQYYLPDTTIIPLLIRDKTPLKDIQKLEKALAPYISTYTPLITSVDFSHYLTLKEAQQKDEITWNIIKSWSIPKLLSLNSNDYLDTPAGVATLLLSMQQKSATRITRNYYDNSGSILKQPNIPTTSYFILTFTK